MNESPNQRSRAAAVPCARGCGSWRFLAAAVLLAAVQGAWALTFSEYRIQVAGDSARATALRQLAWGCAEEVSSLLRVRDPPDTPITVRLVDKAVAPGGDPLDLRLGPELTPTQVADALVRALLVRLVRSMPSGKGIPLENADWLVAAGVNSVLFSDRQFFGRPAPAYQPGRVGFQAGHFPQVADLVRLPVSPDREAAYRLYALHCHLLAATIQSGSRPGTSKLLRVLEMLAAGRSPTDAIAFVVREDFTPEDALQTWYEREAQRVSRRGRRPASTEEIVRRVRQLETVPTVGPGSQDFGCVGVPIEAVAERLKSYQNDRGAVLRLERDFYEVLKDAPQSLHPSLIEYVAAVQALGAGNAGSFKRKVRKAREHFAEAVARQQTLDTYLDSVEERSTPANERLGLYLDAARRSARRTHDLDPQLDAYLDRLGQ